MTAGSDDSQDRKDKTTANQNSLNAVQKSGFANLADSTGGADRTVSESALHNQSDQINSQKQRDYKVSDKDLEKQDSTSITWENVMQNNNTPGVPSIRWAADLIEVGDRSAFGYAPGAGSVNKRDAVTPGGCENADTHDNHPRYFGIGKAFAPSEKRFVLGSEIALAVIIAAAGATRLRTGMDKKGLRTELIPGDNTQSGESTDDKTQLAKPMDGRRPATDAEPQKSSPTAKVKNVLRPKTLVASTDTLISIAEAFFFDRNVAWLIADLNQSILKETWIDNKRIVELKSRQQIELPLREDIEQFFQNKPEHACAENLVTIVEQTAIDSELLNSSLGKLLNPNQE